MNRKREESGEFSERVTLEDVLSVFDDVEGPAITSADVAESLDCTTETARRKLKQLEDEERVESRRTAGRVIWWRTHSELTAGAAEAPPVEVVREPSAPVAPLRDLVGLLDGEETARARERSETFREEFDERMISSES